MTMYRLGLAWSGAAVIGGGLSTFYFDESAGTAAQANTALDTFMQAIKGVLSSSLTWATLPDVGLVNESTGQLTGATTVSPQSGAGTVSGDALPPSNQILVRWLSNTFVNGRRLRGRTFIPGIPETQSTGTLGSTARSTINTAAATLVASPSANLVVYSRRNGAFSQVDSADAWTNFAVLRSRRD